VAFVRLLSAVSSMVGPLARVVLGFVAVVGSGSSDDDRTFHAHRLVWGTVVVDPPSRLERVLARPALLGVATLELPVRGDDVVCPAAEPLPDDRRPRRNSDGRWGEGIRVVLWSDIDGHRLLAGQIGDRAVVTFRIGEP